jgi:serine/threonine-protein kinase
VIFTVSPNAAAMDRPNVAAISLKTGQTRTLVRGGYHGRYLPSGHLVYVREGRLYGVRLDPVRLEVQGEPVPVLEDLAATRSAAAANSTFRRSAHSCIRPERASRQT